MNTNHNCHYVSIYSQSTGLRTSLLMGSLSLALHIFQKIIENDFSLHVLMTSKCNLAMLKSQIRISEE